MENSDNEHPLPLRYSRDKINCGFVSKDAFIGRNLLIDERCKRNELRILEMEKKLSRIQSGTIGILVGVIITIALQLLMG